MEVLELAPGLWRWTTYFGEWRHEVGCVYLETEDAIVLVDPLVPEEPAAAERFWRALDRDVERSGVPVHVLITVFWHTRSTARLVERYDATVHAVSGARVDVTRRSGRVDHVYRGVTELPGGVVAYPTVRRNEVVLWIPAHRAIVPGDVIVGADGGGIAFCPESWLPPAVTHTRLRASLQPLRALPVERVLVSHGAPVLERGHEAIEALLGGA